MFVVLSAKFAELIAKLKRRIQIGQIWVAKVEASRLQMNTLLLCVNDGMLK